jgi:membrane-bound lytic murein transglycosylase D
MKKILYLIVLFLSVQNSGLQDIYAQNICNAEGEQICSSLDMLLSDYHYRMKEMSEKERAKLNKYKFNPEEIPTYYPSDYSKRLKNLGFVIPMDYNSDVQDYIDMYTIRKREQVSRMLGLEKIYFPIFEEQLDKFNLPIELKYLSVVESALNPHARSKMGATGLWQFMYHTGRMYKLKIDSNVDERRDPFKSTVAMIDYFKNMYSIYGDWLLCIAAYNCGPGNVNKAIRKSGGKMNFWEIKRFLPSETRGYVPAFIAACYVFNYPAEHNLYPIPVDFTYFQDTMHFVQTKISLDQIAKVTDTDFYLLKDLNPELKTSIVPYSPEPYVLRVPKKVTDYVLTYGDAQLRPVDQFVSFAANSNGNNTSGFAWPKSTFDESANEQDSLDNDSSEVQSSNSEHVAETETEKNPDHSPNLGYKYIDDEKNSESTPENKKLIYHTVKKGELVGRIADKYHVSEKSIASWNHLKNYKIYPGQKLKIYTNIISTASGPAKPAPAKSTVDSGVPRSYKIQSGDTLWAITQKYEGLTVEHIMALNGLSRNSKLKVGQVLILSK